MTSKSAIPLFLNPAAGRGRAADKGRAIVELLAKETVAVEVVESLSVGDLEQKVYDRVSAGCDHIIVAGGDGSVHEATNGVLQSSKNCALSVIPIGTGNDFAKACGIPLEWERATARLASRINASVAPQSVDAGKMNERFFANGAGIGFDAKVNRIARKYTWPIGDLVYLFAVLEGLWDGVITPNVTMHFDEGTYDGSITMANISNGPWVGGMFFIAPMADNTDGKFDLVFAHPVSRTRILQLLPRLTRGEHVDAPDIEIHALEKFSLRAEESLPSHLDGEPQPLQSNFDIEILPGKLTVV